MAAVSEMYATGTSTMKAQKVAATTGIERFSKDQASAICEYLDSEVEEACWKDAARILEEAEPDALAYLDFLPSHWRRLRTNNVQERVNREIKRRLRVAQVFLSASSLERHAGAVMCDMDEEWREARYFSKAGMDELCDESRSARAEVPPTEEEREDFMLLARSAIEASLELADELQAA